MTGIGTSYLRPGSLWRNFMKKLLVFGLALLLLGSALFADDAKVMPLRTGRLSLAPSFTYGDKNFDKDGSRKDSYDLKAFNFGAALEFGITKWITGAVQWAPGVNIYSDADTKVAYIDMGAGGAVPSKSTVRVLDVGDLFVGAKMQFLGKDGLVKNEMVRLAFAPGIKIPFGGPDFADEYKNAVKGDKVTAATMDNHALAAGLRSYFDFIVNDKFFINFYNEALFYAMKRDLGKVGFEEYITSYLIDQANANSIGAGGPKLFDSGKVKFGYDLTFELEPTFSTPVAKGILFTASMPITYKTTPGKKYDFNYGMAETTKAGLEYLASLEVYGSPAYIGYMTQAGQIGAVIDQAKGLEAKEGQTHALSINPGVAVMFYEWKVPFEFELNYKAPIWGQRASANHSFVFIAKMFFKI